MTDYNEPVNEFAPAGNVAPTAPETPAAPENAYDSIIAQQTKQINVLIAQNQSLTSQITQLINSGAQINQNAAQHNYIVQPSLQDNDEWSLSALAKDIGKRPRRE